MSPLAFYESKDYQSQVEGIIAFAPYAGEFDDQRLLHGFSKGRQSRALTRPIESRTEKRQTRSNTPFGRPGVARGLPAVRDVRVPIAFVLHHLLVDFFHHQEVLVLILYAECHQHVRLEQLHERIEALRGIVEAEVKFERDHIKYVNRGVACAGNGETDSYPARQLADLRVWVGTAFQSNIFELLLEPQAVADVDIAHLHHYADC
ncbi:hypothetical protein BC937DRAFT_94505 [Endogone sp. FLAS-F59071]|nr:hypothetical protein BC937DRAFT_94505 [Endogone sp. FLAS-F59071]|eukprot:RUS20735.1 hypothetical protein BC937DRAFT_94505 [Endogone sp. FLAS-F59071]